MITIKTESQIEKMRKAGALLKSVLDALRAEIQPGVTTLHLDKLAERLIRSAGALPSFKGYNGFPFSICASVDDQVVHGFSNNKPLKQGQLLSVDCGVILNGWQSDSAFSVLVGGGSAEDQKLVDVTEECFWRGAAQARAGNHLGDISHAVQQHAESHGYGVIRDLCGHGIGQEMHEDPNVPNYGKPGRGVKLQAGMVLAIEPMINVGTEKTRQMPDGWLVCTRDGKPSAHFEKTVAITEDGPLILTTEPMHRRPM